MATNPHVDNGVSTHRFNLMQKIEFGIILHSVIVY